MRPLLLLAALLLAPAAARAEGDPVQEASDWKAVIMAVVRAGAPQNDAKACQACASSMGMLPACGSVSPEQFTTRSEGHCEGQCNVGSSTAWDKLVAKYRSVPECAAGAKDEAAIKQLAEAFGPGFADGFAQCSRCVSPEDADKWPERRHALMQLNARLDEGIGKVDAAARAEALAPALAEAREKFECSGGRVDPSSCVLKH